MCKQVVLSCFDDQQLMGKVKKLHRQKYLLLFLQPRSSFSYWLYEVIKKKTRKQTNNRKRQKEKRLA